MNQEVEIKKAMNTYGIHVYGTGKEPYAIIVARNYANVERIFKKYHPDAKISNIEIIKYERTYIQEDE